MTVDTARTSALALALSLAAALSAGDAGADAAVPAAGTGRVVRDGVVVDFSIRPSGAGRSAPLVEGEYAEVRFRMTDAASGRPVPGLKPAAWMDMAGRRAAARPASSGPARTRWGSTCKGSVGIRPMVDLNSYYLLVLNQDASISVIDPVVSMTGSTSLFATVVLKRPAADWIKSLDQKRLFLSHAEAGEVAVVDAETFKVVAAIPAGAEPIRLALQPDGRQLWVGDDAREPGKGGVTVIDTETLEGRWRPSPPAAATTRSRSPGTAIAFVTNRDVGNGHRHRRAALEKVKELATGPLPISVAYSPLSGAIYVADGKSGASR